MENSNNFYSPLSFTNILNYCGSENKRCFREGKNVYLSEHITYIGAKKFSSSINIYASVLQTSAPSGKMHKIVIKDVNKQFEDWELHCTCKSGNLKKCKHAIGSLFYLYYHGQVPFLTCTDVKQAWGKNKMNPKSQGQFGPKLINEMCCVAKSNLCIKNAPQSSDKYFRKLMNAAEHSALTKHFKKTRQLSVRLPVQLVADPLVLEFRYEVACLIEMSDSLMEMGEYEISNDLYDFYCQHIAVNIESALDIAFKTISQSCFLWKKERNLRITASRAYSLYTYAYNKNPDWEKKVATYLKTDNIMTSAIRHGIKYESFALENYSRAAGKSIKKLGLVVNLEHPWLACSPDGLDTAELKIIEIKCPYIGKTETLQTTLPILKFLKFENGSYKLKKNHAYYTQVQINIFVLNCSSCDFVIYGSLEDDIHIINIPRDHEHLTKLLPQYSKVFILLIYYPEFLQKLIIKAPAENVCNNNLIFNVQLINKVNFYKS